MTFSQLTTGSKAAVRRCSYVVRVFDVCGVIALYLAWLCAFHHVLGCLGLGGSFLASGIPYKRVRAPVHVLSLCSTFAFVV